MKEVSQVGWRLQSLIEPLENKANASHDLQGNNAAANLLDNAFNLIRRQNRHTRLQCLGGINWEKH